MISNLVGKIYMMLVHVNDIFHILYFVLLSLCGSHSALLWKRSNHT